MANPVGLLSTATVRQIEDFSEPYFSMIPGDTPTATFLHLLQDSPPKGKKTYWGEEEALPSAGTINYTAGYTDTATSFVFDSTAGMQPGGYLFLPRTLEWIKIGDVAVDGLTIGAVTPCTRHQLGSAAAAIIDNDVVEIKAPSQAENFAYSGVVPLMQVADDVYNFEEIFARGLAISGTEQAHMAHGGVVYGEDYNKQIEKSLWQLKREINYAALNGIRDDAARTSGGIRQYAANKPTSVGDITSRAGLDAVLKDIGVYTQELMVPCSPIALNAFGYYIQANAPTDATGNIVEKAGVNLRTLTLQMGLTLHLYKEPALHDYINAGGADVGQFMCWPKDGFKIAYNRPIGRYKIPPTTDGTTEIVMAELLFKCIGSKRFGVYGGVTKPV